MNLKTCLLLMAVSTLMIGCKKSETKSPYGYPVIFHVNKGGAKPQPGQYCYFNVDMVLTEKPESWQNSQFLHQTNQCQTHNHQFWKD